MTPARGLLLTLLLALIAGCSVPPLRQEPGAPLAAVRLFVSRPLRATPEPDLFVEGAVRAFVEELARAGYDPMGQTLEPDNFEALVEELALLNARRPGTGGLHLTFVEAPSLFGFGTIYTSIRCQVYDSSGSTVFQGALDPPREQLSRMLVHLILPRRHPEMEGRRWAVLRFHGVLGAVFPARGPR